MPISSSRYVNITSAVGGGEAVSTRELLLRLYTTNERVPTGTILNFASSTLSTSLADYFGTDSEEYKQAAYYFGFVSKLATSPKNIQFARWADEATAATIIGSETASLETLQAFTSSTITLIIDGVNNVISGIDLSGAASLADVASILETSISAIITGSTVTYDASFSSFKLETNPADNGTISILAGSGGGLAPTMGWGDDAIYSEGVDEQSVTDVLNDATTLNNNYGSFDFIQDLTNDQIVDRAVFAHGRNVEFMNLQRVTASNRQEIWDLLNGYTSTGLILSPLEDEYPQIFPGALLASLDYDKPAASANFMYQQDSRVTESVVGDADADTNDAIEVNYFGQTQEAGTNLTFFQKGRLLGGSTAPKAMGVHANEQWFKAYLKAQFLNMFLALQQVSADETGEAIGRTYLDAGIAQALYNGSISTGKTLTTTQINYITQLTGESEAYKDVQSRGYFYQLETDPTTNEMTYLLVYAKRDSVDFVDGRHSLI